MTTDPIDLSDAQRYALRIVHEAVLDGKEAVVHSTRTYVDDLLNTAFVHWRTAGWLQFAGLVRLIDKPWGRHEATVIRLTIEGTARVAIAIEVGV